MKTIQFESAQNVHVEYEYALPIQRALAVFLDTLVLVIYMLIFLFVMSTSGTRDFMLLELIMLKIPWILYHPISEYFTQGQTLGKHIVGIRIVKPNGEAPGLREIFTRWIFKGYFLWIGFTFQGLFMGIPELVFMGMVQLSIGCIGFIWASLSEDKQRLCDLMANTYVIKNKSSLSYSLKDVLQIKDQENYTPQYPNAVIFTDEDMLLVKKTIQRLRRNPNEATKKFAIELADESARLLGLPETPQKRMEFLQILLQDYVVLTRS